MATGETRTIDSDLTLTNKYEMTQYDDILNIINATVTLSKPAGDLFTNAGDDTVNITNSTIQTYDSGLSFMLGSGNDTLNLQSSTIDAPILTGSGSDTVIISGDKQSKVTLKKTLDTDYHSLDLGSNADILEIRSVLDGDGDIYFGVEEDTLRFNGGSLLTTGSVGRFTILEVTAAGGILGRSLDVTGLNSRLIFNGSLFGSSQGKVITVSPSNTTSLTTADNIRTDVNWNLIKVTLTHKEGGSLEFSGHTGYAITANNSNVTLHDIVTQSGQAFTGTNTNWKIKDSSFANSTTGMNLTSGSLDLRNVNMNGYTKHALQLEETKLTGADLAFNNNQGSGAIYAQSTEMDITNLRMNGNNTSSHIGSHASSIYDASASASTSASGGGMNYISGSQNIIGATISGNSAAASADAKAEAGTTYYTTNAIASAFASAYASGAGIYSVSDNLSITSASFSGNSAMASASADANQYIPSNDGTPFGEASAFASAMGGGIHCISANLNISSTIFDGNRACAYTYSNTNATTVTWAAGGACALIDTIASMQNTKFNSNAALALAPRYSSPMSNVSYGGGLYLSNSTLDYIVNSGTKLTNTGNQADYGGWLYLTSNSTVNLVIEDKAVLTIGDNTNKDSIGGDNTSVIQKQGSGYLLINSDISDYAGVWTIYGGTVELARIARTIKLDNWTFGENGTLMLSSLDDTISMTASKKISVLDLGGGNDVINTNGYALSNGTLRVSKLKFTGGGQVSSTITNRNPDSGFDLTLDDVVLNSDITGGNAVDKISITQDSTLGGKISLGSGDNVITGTAAVTFKKTVQTVDGNDKLTFTSVTFDQNVMLGSGNNTFSAVTAQFNSGLYLGSGNDTVTFGKSADNSGSVVSKVEIDLGDGTNNLTAYCTADFATVAGGSGTDTILLKKASTISGELDLGGGKNVVYVEDSLAMTDGAVKMTDGGETRIIVYRGTTLTDNTLTVYSDGNAEREAATYSWANQTDLDKVRLVVSSDHTFETFEFAVELYNKSKSFTLDLEKGYFVQFQANDEDGWKQRLVDDTIAPDQVTGVEFNGRLLTWDVTRDNLGGNGVKQYTVEVATDSNFTTVIDTQTITETEYVPQGLGDGTYYFRVCAEDYTQNIGEWSTTVSGQLDTVPPSRPSGGQSSVSGYNVTFSWNAATDTGSGVAEYEYRVASDSTFSTIVRNDTTSTLSVTENNLAYGTYYWQVRAIDNAGNIGEWSLRKSVKTQDKIAPTIPGNVDYSVDAHSVTVIWDASQDDALGSGMKDYTLQLSHDSSFSSILQTVTVTATEAVINDLSDGEYYLRVGAGDNAGNQSTWSSVQNFTIDAPITKALTITAASDSKTYDGSALTNGNYTWTPGVLGENDELVVTISGSITDAGLAVNRITSYKIMRGETDVTSKYTNISVVNGTLSVMKRNVTLTSADDTKVYDGTALTNHNITVSGDGFVGSEGYTVNVTGSQLDVGTSKNSFGYTLNNGTKADNYNITTETGTLEVTRILKPITITANSNSKMYDGTALTDTGYTFTQGILVDGDELIVTLEGTITDAGTASNVVTDYKVMRGDVDVTGNYTFADSVAGTLTVTKRNVTMISASDSKIYDGIPLTNDTITVSGDGFVDGESATYIDFASQINVGITDNTFHYVVQKDTLLDNYQITQKYGTLEVFYKRFVVANGEIFTFVLGSTYTNPEVYAGNGGAGEIQTSGVLIGNTVSISGNTATENGGAFINAGTASITDSTLNGNTASKGGAIYNDSGTVSISGSTLSGNTASQGGAIDNSGKVSISGSILSGNTASLGGAIYNTGTVNFTGEVTLATNSDTIYSEGTLNWDLTGTTTGKLNGYNLLTNNGGTLQITVSAEQTSVSYILASGDFTDIANKDTFTITGIQGEADQTITIGSDKVFYGDLGYCNAPLFSRAALRKRSKKVNFFV